MKRSQLFVFPDTNLFMQCNDLPSLDWGKLGEFEEIRLIVARPIQKEIDRHKGSGNGRLGRRARKASSMLRKIVADELTSNVISKKNPQVLLDLIVNLRPSPDLRDQLDYTEPDDTLVGIAYAFAADHPNREVVVLTHDAGVMASAVAVGVRHLVIPDSWLSAPEDTKIEKDLKAAHAEINRLQNSEPRFEVHCVASDAQPVKQMHYLFRDVKRLTDTEIANLIDRARARFPMKTDFHDPGSKAADESSKPFDLEMLKGLNGPPSKRQIAEYHKQYEAWEQALRRSLEQLHHRLRRETAIGIEFSIENTGTRPANDVLIEIEADGGILLRAPQSDPDRTESKGEILPAPPEPPIRYISMIEESLRAGGYLYGSNYIDPLRYHDLIPRSQKRDPEGFYYKGGKREFPEATIKLECMLWRHGIEPMFFEAEIDLDDIRNTSGAVIVRVHAANLTEHASVRIPVTIDVENYSTFDHATKLINQITRSKPK